MQTKWDKQNDSYTMMNGRLLILVPDHLDPFWLCWVNPGHRVALCWWHQSPQRQVGDNYGAGIWEQDSGKKKVKEAWTTFPTLRKEDNCIVMDHRWCTFSVSPAGCSCSGWSQGLPIHGSSPLEALFEKQSPGTPLTGLELCLCLPRPFWLPYSSGCCTAMDTVAKL